MVKRDGEKSADLGRLIEVYIDDILVLASSYKKWQEQVMWLHGTLTRLGFLDYLFPSNGVGGKHH